MLVVMVAAVVGGCRWGVSLLSLIPHRITRSVPGWGWVVGVAGWNTSAAWFRTCRLMPAGWARALLGPEETPVWCVLGAASWLGV